MLPRRLSLLAGCLLLLQGADFLLTWLLLRRPDVYEANPLALAILSRHGWVGLGSFKLLCSVVAVAAVLMLFRRHAVIARRLLTGLCAVMFVVVGYSGVLLAGPRDPMASRLPRLRQEGEWLADRIAYLRRFDLHRTAICRQLLVGEYELETAVAHMTECLIQFHPELAGSRRLNLPDIHRPAQVAAYLYHHSSRLVWMEPHLRPHLGRLALEMARCFPTAPRIDIDATRFAIDRSWSLTEHDRDTARFPAS